MADIVLVNPRFEVSYWGLEHALPLLLKRANVPPACLPLLAALTPGEHQVTLIDENVEPINYDRLARADIVGITGMSVQRGRMREILEEVKQRNVFTVVGGPWVTVREDYFGPLADVIFVGEAEDTWPQFLQDWQRGCPQPRYEQSQPTDMTRVPLPRLDLLKMRHYLFGSMQFSRGCPFQCEFCDIIVTFGRRPRLKTNHQILRELESLRAQGLDTCFIVDDNLIGNKKAVKVLLRDVADWQRANGFPFTFFTEASLDLAEDAELMQLMVDANVNSVFIGIESPNEASLRETKKFQNLRTEATLTERIRTVQRAGMDVWCGMILGFDHDDASIFAAQRDCLVEGRVLHAMVGMLYAIPKTPLHARLAAEGRLDEENEAEFGTNIIPALMTRTELRDGYLQLLDELYQVEPYFDRLDSLFLDREFRFATTRAAYWRRHPWAWFKGELLHVARAAGIFWQLMTGVPDKSLRAAYRRRVFRLLCRRPDPVVVFVYLLKCAIHYHQLTMLRGMTSHDKPIVSTI